MSLIAHNAELIANLTARLEVAEAVAADATTAITLIATATDTFYLMVVGIFVFWMQERADVGSDLILRHL